ncbi:hypothetical protein BJX65DRAFT_57505 [Aspergillus insuetus]
MRVLPFNEEPKKPLKRELFGETLYRHHAGREGQKMMSLSTLPMEVMALILNNVPDIFTLLSATKASHFFLHALKTRERQIIASRFQNEWSRLGRFDIKHTTCGRLLREVLALARTEFIDPVHTERILGQVWASFAQRKIEEALLPVCLAIARSYIRVGQPESAINLLDSAWNGRDPFTYSIPASIGRDFDDEDRLAAAMRRRRDALFPVGKLLATLLSAAGEDTTLLRQEVGNLRTSFQRAPLLVIGRDQVALFPWAYMPESRELFDDGIWCNVGESGLPGCVKALVRISRWAGSYTKLNNELRVDSIVRTYRLSRGSCLFSSLGTDALFDTPGGDFLRIYTGDLPRDTKLVDDMDDADLTEAVTADEQEVQRKNELIAALLSGSRGDGPVSDDEILAAAGEYNAQRIVVDLLSRHYKPSPGCRYQVLIVLRTFHLATVVRHLRALGDKLSIGEDILTAAAENPYGEKGILKFVLDR